MAFSIADTYVPAHPTTPQDVQYSSCREQSSSEEREALAGALKKSIVVLTEYLLNIPDFLTIKLVVKPIPEREHPH